MQMISVSASSRARIWGSFSTRREGRRVDPKAVSWLLDRDNSVLARAKNSSSLGRAPGHPPSMKWTPSSSRREAIRSLSETVREIPSCWAPSRRVVS